MLQPPRDVARTTTGAGGVRVDRRPGAPAAIAPTAHRPTRPTQSDSRAAGRLDQTRPVVAESAPQFADALHQCIVGDRESGQTAANNSSFEIRRRALRPEVAGPRRSSGRSAISLPSRRQAAAIEVEDVAIEAQSLCHARDRLALRRTGTGRSDFRAAILPKRRQACTRRQALPGCGIRPCPPAEATVAPDTRLPTQRSAQTETPPGGAALLCDRCGEKVSRRTVLQFCILRLAGLAATYFPAS